MSGWRTLCNCDINYWLIKVKLSQKKLLFLITVVAMSRPLNSMFQRHPGVSLCQGLQSAKLPSMSKHFTTLCVSISLSASVALVCLFTPKMYIIIFQPEKNVRKLAMMMNSMHRKTGKYYVKCSRVNICYLCMQFQTNG